MGYSLLNNASLSVISRRLNARGLRAACFLLAAASLTAADWPGFRGPNATGVFDTPGLPVEFGPDEGVAWKTPLPPGQSSPVLTERHVFLTGYEPGKLWTLALDRKTGKILWRRDLNRLREERMHRLNSPASASPATDGENAYVFSGDFGLASYGPDGNERWRLPLGPFTNLHGMSASPIVVDDRVIVACDQDEDAYLLAVHKDSGKIAWKTPRPEVVHGFSTPSILQPNGEPAQIIVPGSYHLIAYSAKSGAKLWWVRGLTWQVKPSAVIAGETVYATGWAPGVEPAQRQVPPSLRRGRQRGRCEPGQPDLPARVAGEVGSPPEAGAPSTSMLMASSARVTGSSTAPDGRRGTRRSLSARATHAGTSLSRMLCGSMRRAVPVVPSPVLYDGIFYIIKNGGILTSLDPETGAVLKQGRLDGAIDKYYASPVAGDGKLYFTGELGKISVVKPGGEWELLRVNDMQEPIYASPAIGDRRLYVRTESALYAFGPKE